MDMDIKRELMVYQSLEPMVLVLGENFDMEEDADIAQIKWSCVYSLNKDNRIINLFNNASRRAKSILFPSDLEKTSWDTKEMPFVWLLGHDELISEQRNEFEIESDAGNMFFDVCKRLKEFGRIVCVGFELNDGIIGAKEISRVCHSLKRTKLVYFLKSNEAQLTTDSRLANLIEDNYVVHNSEPISDILTYDQTDVDWIDDNDQSGELLIYADGKPIYFADSDDMEAVFLMSRFAKLLNYKEVMRNVYIHKEQEHMYFKSFLRNENVGITQWYGYRSEYNFHFVRDFETTLYNKTIKALNDASTRERKHKPIMLCGQACSGKTSALKALAVRIFTEKKFPVVYISDAELNFNNPYTDEGGVMQFSAFERLDKVLDIIESKVDKEEKAVATLIIWDTAAYNYNSRYKAFDLLTALRSCGRRVQLVCSSYDFVDKKNVIYDIVNVDIDMPNTEWMKISAFLQKVGLSSDDVEMYIKRYGKEANFLSTLYMVDELKTCLQERVSREVILGTKEMAYQIEKATEKENFFENAFAIALRKAYKEAGIYFESIYTDNKKETQNISTDYKEFITLLSICKWYGKEMPYTLFLRLLGDYSSESQKIRDAVMEATFLKLSEDESDYWKSTISVRSELEAKLLLLDCDVNPLTREGKQKILSCVLELLDNISEVNENEINMMRSILKMIGPNIGDNQFSEKSVWNDAYEKIPDVLKCLSDKRKGGDDNYILQEVSYRREYYQDSKCELPDSEKYIQYAETKDIVESKIEELRKDETILGVANYGMSPILSSLLVESSNIILRMHNLSCIENSIHRNVFTVVNQQMREVIKRDPGNAYSYSAVIQAGIQQIEDNGGSNSYSEESLKILKMISSLIDVFTTSSYRFSDESRKALRKLEASVNSKMDEINGDEGLFKEYIQNKQPEMIYFRANKMLHDYEKKFHKKFDYGAKLETLEQNNICKDVIELFDKYKDITYSDGACLYLLINLKWLLYNRFPLFGMQECCPTKLSRAEWEELEILCERYNTYSTYSKDNISYLYAFCVAQKREFKRAMEILRQDRETRNYEKRALHILCDENGVPLKFRGRLKNNYDKEKRRGYMAVYYGEQLLDANVIYRAENIHRKSSDLKRDDQIMDVEISISFSGFQAHTKSISYDKLMEEEEK